MPFVFSKTQGHDMPLHGGNIPFAETHINLDRWLPIGFKNQPLSKAATNNEHLVDAHAAIYLHILKRQVTLVTLPMFLLDESISEKPGCHLVSSIIRTAFPTFPLPLSDLQIVSNDVSKIYVYMSSS